MSQLTDPRKEFGRAVTAIAADNDRIVVLSADSGKSSGFGDFAKAYPERYFEFGIMEQGVTGIASGLATTGLIPVFAAIAPFVTSRSYEMVRNDLGYMGQNAKIVGRNGGFTYADLGATHHSLEDYAIMRMIPGLVVFAPSDPGDDVLWLKALFRYDHRSRLLRGVGVFNVNRHLALNCRNQGLVLKDRKAGVGKFPHLPVGHLTNWLRVVHDVGVSGVNGVHVGEVFV